MKQLTKQEKGYLFELFKERTNKLNEIEQNIKCSLALSLGNYQEQINLERKLINEIKETIYTY